MAGGGTISDIVGLALTLIPVNPRLLRKWTLRLWCSRKNGPDWQTKSTPRTIEDIAFLEG